MENETWYETARKGRLLERLVTLPQDKWKLKHAYGDDLLALACLGENVAAAITLINAGLPIDYDKLVIAVSYNNSTMVKLFLSYNVNVRQTKEYRYTLMYRLIIDNKLVDHQEELRLILANGWRLKRDECFYLERRGDPYGILKFQQGVLRCRDVIVTLLGLKKFRRGQTVLSKLDRFLVRQELAVAIWSTRCDSKAWNHQSRFQRLMEVVGRVWRNGK